METILYSRIKVLCEKYSITLSKLESDIGLATSSIRKWKSTSSPSIDKILLVAKYFNVSSDYLIGLSDIPSSAEDIIGDADFVSLQRARARMSPQDNERMIKMLKIGFDYAFDNDPTE